LTFLGKKIAVALPDSLLEERDSLREKTAKLGSVARACAIYGVDVIEIFRGGRGRSDSKLIQKVLGYLETPQYLRRRLFPLDEELKFAGLLPPLRIPSHKKKAPPSSLTPGEFREGVVNPDGTVDVGLDIPLLLQGKGSRQGRVTVKLTSIDPLAGEPVPRSSVPEYWGYSVEAKEPAEVVEDRRFALIIATSRYGEPLRSAKEKVRRAMLESPSIKLIFGSPSSGLSDLLGKDLLEKATCVLNLFAEQHVQTVRTEEALAAGLNLVNALVA
jgi:methyltransferase